MSTKIHATVDALGNPLRLLLSGGQVADITQAQDLIAGLTAQAVVGDKGYDADALVQCIEKSGAQAVKKDRTLRLDFTHVLPERSGCRNNYLSLRNWTGFPATRS